MEYTKKMTLVPEEIARAVQASSIKDNPTRHVLSKLDNEMHAILNSDGMSDKEKVVRYNEVLQKFLQLHQHEAKPVPIHVNIEDVNSQNTHDKGEPNVKSAVRDEVRNKVLKLLPATLKKRGDMLLDHLLSHPTSTSWQWNDLGELIYDGKVVRGSNIVDLIYDVLKGRKSSQPLGWQHFLRVLVDSNVPESLLSNVERRTLFQEIKSKSPAGAKPLFSSPKVLPLTPVLTTTTKPTSFAGTKRKYSERKPLTRSKKPTLKWEEF